jgi:hypothetical protein
MTNGFISGQSSDTSFTVVTKDGEFECRLSRRLHQKMMDCSRRLADFNCIKFESEPGERDSDPLTITSIEMIEKAALLIVGSQDFITTVSDEMRSVTVKRYPLQSRKRVALRLVTRCGVIHDSGNFDMNDTDQIRKICKDIRRIIREDERNAEESKFIIPIDHMQRLDAYTAELNSRIRARLNSTAQVANQIAQDLGISTAIMSQRPAGITPPQIASAPQMSLMQPAQMTALQPAQTTGNNNQVSISQTEYLALVDASLRLQRRFLASSLQNVDASLKNYRNFDPNELVKHGYYQVADHEGKILTSIAQVQATRRIVIHGGDDGQMQLLNHIPIPPKVGGVNDAQQPASGSTEGSQGSSGASK